VYTRSGMLLSVHVSFHCHLCMDQVACMAEAVRHRVFHQTCCIVSEPSVYRILTAGAVTISWQNSTGAAILAFSVRCTPWREICYLLFRCTERTQCM
jgi:hypothetical protein